MSAAIVRCHYDDLSEVSQAFQHQSESAQRLLQTLRRTMAVLQDGDWMGQGASAFYQEMAGQVFPTLERLSRALELAAQNTTQISQIMQQAEDEAARLLGGSATNTGTLFAAPGVLAGPKDGGGSGSGSGGAGSGSGKSTGSKSGGGGAAAAQAAENAAVDRMLSKFDPKVRALVKQSPTLRAQLKALEDKKFPLTLMPRPKSVDPSTGSQTFFHPPAIEVYIDPKLKPEDMVLRVAHEAAIAQEDPQFLRPQNAKNRQHFIDTNVPKALRAEAKAMFNEVAVRQEILAAKGPDIGLSDPDPVNHADYLDPFNDYQKSKRTPQDLNNALDLIERDYDANMELRKGYVVDLNKDFDQCQKTRGRDCGRW